MELVFSYLAPVETVLVTADNMEDVAKWCGGRVAQTESRRVAGRMDSYVWVPTPKGSGISWAFAGMYVTKRLVYTMKGESRTTFAVFRKDYFLKNYYKTSEEAKEQTWDKQVAKEDERVSDEALSEELNGVLKEALEPCTSPYCAPNAEAVEGPAPDVKSFFESLQKEPVEQG